MNSRRAFISFLAASPLYAGLGFLGRAFAQTPVSDGVDASVDVDQPSGTTHVPDGAAVEAQRQQLRHRYVSVLPGRQPPEGVFTVTHDIHA